MNSKLDSRPSRAGAGFIHWLLRPFDSVWMGIFWASLLFVYCSIGSAVPPVRQNALLEMTEFEWFHWWPFNALILLLCATLIVVTVRRIPFRVVNLGVWAIHAGIIILCIGSYIYFGTKVEGDTPVFRRQIHVELPGAAPTNLIALPGSEKTVLANGQRWRFAVQNTNNNWPILSDEHKGETAFAINVSVTPPQGQPFIRQLLEGYPQYTEDVIPGKGRAIKSLGRKLVEESLKMSLALSGQEWFHVMDTSALFVRRVGDTEWTQRPIHGLPHYQEHVASRDQVILEPNMDLPLRSLDLPVASASDSAIGAIPMHVTGYLRYAEWRRQWSDGGDFLNPMVRVSFLANGAVVQSHELLALDRNQHLSEDGMIELRWLSDASGVSNLPIDSRAALTIHVPSTNFDEEVPITNENVVGRDGPFLPIEGTDFSYRIRNVQDNLSLPGSNGLVSVAMVDIKTPEGEFTRMVADDASMTKDMHGDDPHGGMGAHKEFVQADQRVRMEYRPQSPPIILAMYTNGLHLVANGSDGRLLGRDVEVGEVVEIVEGLSIRVDNAWMRAKSEDKPYIVPVAERKRDVGNGFSMIRLEVDTGHGIAAKWLRFNQYALPNESYAYGGRFSYMPERFRLADGSVMEVLYSRERRRLPHPVALDDFKLDTHIGGYTGAALTIRNYVSQLSFDVDGKWTPPRAIQVNGPTEESGYWYFQSTWDKPSDSAPSGGMNYTGLGVGNRNGVHIQLAGCCIAVAGMLFAFYIKPVLRRRRAKQSRARVHGTREANAEEMAVGVAPLH